MKKNLCSVEKKNLQCRSVVIRTLRGEDSTAVRAASKGTPFICCLGKGVEHNNISQSLVSTTTTANPLACFELWSRNNWPSKKTASWLCGPTTMNIYPSECSLRQRLECPNMILSKCVPKRVAAEWSSQTVFQTHCIEFSSKTI